MRWLMGILICFVAQSGWTQSTDSGDHLISSAEEAITYILGNPKYNSWSFQRVSCEPLPYKGLKVWGICIEKSTIGPLTPFFRKQPEIPKRKYMKERLIYFKPDGTVVKVKSRTYIWDGMIRWHQEGWCYPKPGVE